MRTADAIAYLAILDLLNRYTDALNQRNWAELRNVFADRGPLDFPAKSAGTLPE